MPGRRILVAAIAVLGAFALLLQLWLSLRNAPAMGLTPGQALWRYFGYFTILTNLLVVMALTARTMPPRAGMVRILRRTDVQTAVAVAIVIVAIVYHLILSRLWHPQGWSWLADQLLHTVMPLLFVLHWWFGVSKASLRWRHVLACLPYPLAYAAYVLLRGAVDGWYPYPFIDVATLGYLRVGRNACGLLVAFVAVACVLVASGRWQARKTRAGVCPE